MKRILITGERSYLGKNLDRYLQRYNAQCGREVYRVDSISLRTQGWENTNFSAYDTVVHMVGLAHADVGHVTEENKKLYYDVNCELAIQTAKKAKAEGVKQFIYMSSVIVYGAGGGIDEQKQITAQTTPNPENFYGDSKFQAEKGLKALEDDAFCVAIIRSPMVYGKDCKGNFRQLAGLAERFFVFPAIQNQRSMIYVENLAEFIRLLIESKKGGYFYPQNQKFVSTAELVVLIGKARGKKIRLWKEDFNL